MWQCSSRALVVGRGPCQSCRSLGTRMQLLAPVSSFSHLLFIRPGKQTAMWVQVVIAGPLGPRNERPDRNDIRSIIVAGGGTVLPLARGLRNSSQLAFAVVHADAACSDANVQKLVKAKV